MPTGVAMVRGINVGGKNTLPMVRLRALCEGLGWTGVRTYIQSGNVAFRCDARSIGKAGTRLEDAIETAMGFRPSVVVRSLDELRGVVWGNPFARTPGADGPRLLVMALAVVPSPAAAKAFAALRPEPEALRLIGREAYLHFPNGVAESSIPMSKIEKTLGVPGTVRNWNTIEKLIELAEVVEAGAGEP